MHPLLLCQRNSFAEQTQALPVNHTSPEGVGMAGARAEYEALTQEVADLKETIGAMLDARDNQMREHVATVFEEYTKAAA